MTKRTHDLLRDLLDELTVTPIYTAACARCRISTRSLWRYIRASQAEDDPDSYRLVWSDVDDWFHNHLKQAMRMSALMIEATARQHALNGFDEVQVFQGKICWKEDPKLAGLSDEELTRRRYSDRYERNPDGSLVPLTVRRKPSDQLVLKMLASHFPRAYGDRIEHHHSGIIPVARLCRDGKIRPVGPPKEIEDGNDDLVVSADNGAPIDPSKMRIGLLVGEPLSREEFERAYGGPQPLREVEFEGLPEDGSVSETDGAVTVVKSPEQQEPGTPAAASAGVRPGW